MNGDPLRAFNFNLLIEGVSAGSFIECSGIGADVDVIPYREGGANQQIRHLAGQVRYQPMVLRYGLTRAPGLWDWFDQAVNGSPQPRNISVVVFADDGASEALRWNLYNAWVSAWRASTLDATVGEVAIDTMRVVYDRLERD